MNGKKHMIPLHKIAGRLGNQMFQFAYIYGQMKLEYIPDFYVQDPNYFDHCKDEIKALFSEGITKIDQVAIHVRRGDYVNNPFYVDLIETPYYRDAMALFPGESFLVFSDDIEWCKKQKIFQHCEFSEGRDEIEDLNLMASCKAVITANSSFSWWGGFLCKGKVIAPEAWYADGITRTKLPEEWKRL